MTKRDREIYSEIYRACGIGVESLLSLVDKSGDNSLTDSIRRQMAGYNSLAEKAKTALNLDGTKAADEKKMKVMAATTGIAVETFFNSSPSHIASMIIRGSEADIKSLNTVLEDNCRKDSDCRESAADKLASDLLSFEDKNIRIMQAYL